MATRLDEGYQLSKDGRKGHETFASDWEIKRWLNEHLEIYWFSVMLQEVSRSCKEMYCLDDNKYN